MNKIPFLDLKVINAKFEKEILVAVEKTIKSGWYIFGKELNLLEESIPEYTGLKYAAGVGSGLDALTLMIEAYDFPAKSEIIVPSNTYIATILSILRAGHIPILVEPDINSYLLNIGNVFEKITEKTVAILNVELYGKSGRPDLLREFCEINGLKLLLDAAQSLGSQFMGLYSSSFYDSVALSFYPTKNLGALGDAGAIVSNNEKLIYKIRSLRNYGSSKKYFFDHLGINSRLDEIQATILNVKLPHLRGEIELKRRIANRYIQEISNQHIILPDADAIFEDSWHLFVIRVNDRENFCKYMRQHNIGIDIHYPIPPHKQKALPQFNNLTLPVTELIHKEVVSLPMNISLSKENIDYIITTINHYL